VRHLAKKVKLHEIAKSVGITSGELIEICQKVGHAELNHHSRAVTPEQAEELRKTAIRLYKPKQTRIEPEPPQPKPKKPKPAPRRAAPLPTTDDVKPVPPPKPKGSRAATETALEGTEEPGAARTRPRARRRSTRRKEDEGEVRTRTIIFKQPKRTIAAKRVDKAELVRPVSVRELSESIGVPAAEIIRQLMFEHGIRANINQVLDDEVVQLIGIAHEVEVTLKDPRTAEDTLLASLPEDAPQDLKPRPPVVAMLGHVDHGKTSILDSIRNTRVAEGEAGGITQDIGAWQVQTGDGTITFIDTPGHEAFSAMRARGAKVTDIVVLVVAADDGVMPQTVEAINHARAANVPIIVAVNKIDRPEANPLRTRQQLAGQGLNAEEWGGDVGFVDLSAVTGEGVGALLERIVLEAELLELKANPDRAATGAVLEARMVPGRGVVTNVIVQRGTLRVGDILVCGNAYGTVRSLTTQRGEQVQEAGPSQPVAMSGLNRSPEAGDTFAVVGDLETARKVAEERDRRVQQLRRKPLQRVTLETLFDRLERGEMKQFNVVLKADVQGSLEPLMDSLARLGDKEVAVRVIHSAIGNVNPSDVLLADAAEAVIIAFRVRADENVRDMAAARGIEIIHYDVIYNVTDQIHAALEGLLEPEKRQERVGLAEVRRIFRISRYGRIAGCYVTEGAIRRNCRVRIIRGGEVLHDGAISSLRQEKSDVREVEAGRECGINVEGFDAVQEGDQIEAYTTVVVRRTLSRRSPREASPQQSGADAP